MLRITLTWLSVELARLDCEIYFLAYRHNQPRVLLVCRGFMLE